MLRCGGRRRAILSAFARFPWLQTQLLENVRLMRVLSQHYGKYRASGRALRDKIISLSSQCRRSSFLKQPMEEAGPSLPSTTSARSSQPRADEEAPMEPMQVCFYSPGSGFKMPLHFASRVARVHTADAWEALAPAVGRCWRMQCAVCLRSGGSVSEKQDRSA